LERNVLLISETETEPLLDLTELREAMEEALIDFSSGRVTQPLRTVLRIEEYDGWFGLMPAIYRDVIGAKLVTVFAGNAVLGLHTHDAVIQLFRRDTGEPLAVVGGRTVTALRTAAVSALATRLLAQPDSRVLALLGSGVQARTHLAALKLVREFEEVRVWSRTAEHATRFAKETGARALSAEEAVRGADVIVTVTNASAPILEGRWLKEGAHVNAVGAVGPGKREIDDQAMKNSAVIVESREAAVRESVDITQSGASIYSELGELLGGTACRPIARNTVYKSLGIAVEDVAAARLVYEKALRETG
jgi:thiomorpholine-carboxylate dehydrogenase